MRKIVLVLLIICIGFAISCQTTDDGIYYEDRVAVLMYHHFDDAESSVTITAERFEQHMEMLVQNGYTVISIRHMIEWMKGEETIPPNAVVLTFDDGYKSVYEVAFPVLREKNMPASVYMIVKHIGATEDQIPKITWEQMREMNEYEIEFHSHSYDLHYYHTINAKGDEDAALTSYFYDLESDRQETKPEYEARVKQDLLRSRQVLEDGLDRTVDIFSAPYGQMNDTVLQLCRQVGFTAILLTHPAMVHQNTDLMAIPRINAGTVELSADDLDRLIRNKAR